MRFLPLLAVTTVALAASSAIAQTSCYHQPIPQLRIAAEHGQTTFHVGERIPLTLSFTGSAGDHVNNASYDRSGRLSIDTYSVTPSTGWTDPLADYYAHAGIYDGGGLFNIDTLEKPFRITRDLNEWVRFDQPGDYTITAVSERVTIGPDDTPIGGKGIELTSQPLTLHIIAASTEWQQATLDRIRKVLAQPKPHYQDDQLDPRATALDDLRYLASPASIPLLASFLREDSTISNAWWTSTFGLYGLPAPLHDQAITAVTRLLDAPGFPVTNAFLETLSNLQRPVNEAEPSGPNGLDEHYAAYNARFDTNWRLAVAALGHKQDSALATSAHTLLASTPQNASDQERHTLAAVLSVNFLALTSVDQVKALNSNWDALRSSAMLPVLRMLADSHYPKSAYVAGNHSLIAAALRRWYTLDPDGALREIQARIGSSKPSLDASDLDFLPELSFPQFESAWAAALDPAAFNDNKNAVAELLVRFGTGAASPAVIASLAKTIGGDDCRLEAAELAYLIRFDADDAAPLLAHAAASKREQSGCRTSLFTSVAAQASGPALVHAAVEALNDPDPVVQSDAVGFLTLYGDTSARQPLLDRFLQWSASLATHPRDFKPDAAANGSPELDYDRQLGDLLATDLLSNQGWLADADLAVKVHRHCSTSDCRDLAGTPPSPVSIQAIVTGSVEQGTIAQFQPQTRELFEAKISQFPEGTIFSINTVGLRGYDEEQYQSFIRDVLQRHHMTLASLRPPQIQKTDRIPAASEQQAGAHMDPN